MNINIIAVGKIKKKYLKDGIDEYKKRIDKYININIIEIDEYKITNENNITEIKEALKFESLKIIKRLKPNSYTIALDIKGEEFSSIDLANKICEIQNFGYKEITFIIGSSFGLSDLLDKYIDLHISFGKITLPHQLFRIVLLEQIYRAFKIINNEPYHK